MVCFSGRGTRHLMMSNTVLMQYTDATQYDLLIIAEPLNKNYRHGVPWLGSNLREVCEWISEQDLVKSYRNTRTFGCSAGGFPSILAAYYLSSEIALSVGGRFFKNRLIAQNIKMLLMLFHARLKSRNPKIYLSYSPDKTRDRKFAAIMSTLFGYQRQAIKFPGEKTEHRVLNKLMEHGKLTSYLHQTVFSSSDSNSKESAKTELDFQASP